MSYHRRKILQLLSASSVATIIHEPLFATAQEIDPRYLWVKQVSTSTRPGEELRARVLTSTWNYDMDQIQALRWIFRDWRDTDAAVAVDVRLFAFLAQLQAAICQVHGTYLPITITSAYRTRERNATIENAAVNSQHIHGRAADLWIEGVSHTDIHGAADAMGAPGLGRYSSFTHIDVGPPGRRWGRA